MIRVIFEARLAADLHVLNRHRPARIKTFAERYDTPAAGDNRLSLLPLKQGFGDDFIGVARNGRASIDENPPLARERRQYLINPCVQPIGNERRIAQLVFATMVSNNSSELMMASVLAPL